MKSLNDFVKSASQKGTRSQTTGDMKVCIKQEAYLEALSELLSPLNPSLILSEIWWESITFCYISHQSFNCDKIKMC